jgi:hypothetical protein
VSRIQSVWIWPAAAAASTLLLIGVVGLLVGEWRRRERIAASTTRQSIPAIINLKAATPDLAPPKYAIPESEEARLKVLDLMLTTKSKYELAYLAWIFPLTQVDSFRRVTAFDPPIELTATLADRPTDWSVCIAERQITGNENPELFTTQSELHSLLWRFEWAPMVEALLEMQWPTKPFSDGKTKQLEWRFTDESDASRHRLVFRFRLIEE